VNLYPFKLKPVLKDIIWGGTRLASKYGKSDGQIRKIAESWELAVHKNGMSLIENGEYAGCALGDLFKCDKSIVSPGYKSDVFPLLVKFIDAGQDLSVQVHPGDEYAAKHENESGKTEMWYIIDALPESRIVYGLNGRYTREELRALIAENRFEECLNYIKVKPGEAYFIPAGLVHAIGEGILILEIQQNSDSTYRFYDYNRLGTDNKPRELHIEKALDVCIKSPVKAPGNSGCGILAACEYFQAEIYQNVNYINFELETVFMNCVTCIKGEGKIICEGKMYDIKSGESYFLAAGTGKCQIEGNAVFVTAKCGNG